MAKLPRVTNKRFGSDIELDNIGQFGSAAAGQKNNTKDVAEIQALEAWRQGWTKATMSQNKYPTMQERNGLDYVHAYQIDYLLREGIAEYDSQTEYNADSIVKGIVNNEMKLFSSVLDQNIGQDLTNENAWKELSFGGGLEISDKITNCLLEVPQNIQLELNNGTLTLKAGSKVIVPNGANVFEEYTLPNNVSLSSGGAAGKKLLFYRQGNNTIMAIMSTNCYVGTSAPSGTAYQVWYNTSENKIYADASKTGNWVSTYKDCLPLGVITSDGTNVTSLDEIFQSFGYLGNLLFCHKGVKGLIPNGRNIDGTLKNTEFTTSKVVTVTDTSARTNQKIVITATTIGIRSAITYLEDENFNYNDVTKKTDGVCVVGTFSKTATEVTELKPDLPIHLANNKDILKLEQEKFPVTGGTLEGNLIIQRSAPRLYLYHTELDRGDTPSENEYCSLIFGDKNKTHLGQVNVLYATNGNKACNLTCNSKDGATSANIAVGFTANGQIYTSAPTPATGNNSTQIATTAFVNKQCDGQWIRKFLRVAENVTLPIAELETEIEYDLSSYLPNDGYNYEVLVSADFVTGAKSGADIHASVVGTGTKGQVPIYARLAYINTRTSSSMGASGSTIIPIGTDRKITLSYKCLVANALLGGLNLEGYRRIGVNA